MSTAVPGLTSEVARIDSYRLRRSSRDFYERGLIGPVFYFVAYLLLLSMADYPQRWGWWCAVPAVLFAALGTARWRHRLPADDAPREVLERWGRTHWRLVYANSVAWGLVPALVGWLERAPDSAIVVTSLSTMAFSTATSQAFAMDAPRARLSMVALLLPGVAVYLWPSFDLRATGVTLFFYGFYLLANLRRSAVEYTRQLDTEVELLRSRAEVSVLSLTDSLTGLANRRSYELAWAQASSTAVRQAMPLALLMLDLDHFKSVNDGYGHAGGDACLQHCARVLREHFRRDSDFIARLGGEEFVVLLPGTTQAEALALSERLRAGLAGAPCLFEGVEIALTVSVGVALLDEREVDPSLTYRHADTACYAAKKNGRNRVVAWTAALEPRTVTT